MPVCVLAQAFRGGLFAGMSASQINGDELSGYDLPGGQAGFFVFLPSGDRGAWQLELSFIQKGARELPSDTSIFYRARLNYVTIPLLYRYRLNQLSFEIGPALDINVYAQESDRNGDFESNPPFNRFGLSGIFGVNYHFSEHFWVAFRTNNSILVIRPGTPLPGFGASPRLGGFGQRNLILTFGLHYAFF